MAVTPSPLGSHSGSQLVGRGPSESWAGQVCKNSNVKKDFIIKYWHRAFTLKEYKFDTKYIKLGFTYIENGQTAHTHTEMDVFLLRKLRES